MPMKVEAVRRVQALEMVRRGLGHRGPGLLGAIALAGPALADAEYDRCIARSNSTNVEWAACGGAWIEREDRRLNETWRRLLPKLPRQSRADLLAEQRAWIAYKDKACTFYRNGDFGREGQVLHGPRRLAGVIARRRDELGDIEAFLAPQ